MEQGPHNRWLLLAGFSSLSAAVAHLGVIVVGPAGYRAFGAGEAMAGMAERGDPAPALITLFIAGVLIVWALVAFSGAGWGPRLPWRRPILVAIAAVYLLRGAYGPFLPYLSDHPDVQAMGPVFWWLSSAICLVIGGFHAIGLKQTWHKDSHPCRP